jgi:nucleoside-diphosphate-sugar epimerase
VKRAFITGATGFIGRCLIQRLAARGVSITAMVRHGATQPLNESQSFVGDLFSPIEELADAMRGCDVLLHLAAAVSFAPSARAELERINGEGTRRILDAAKAVDVGRVVVVSSACTLGLSASASHPLDENAPFNEALAQRNPYLASKHLAERHAMDAADRGQYVVIVNPTTVFGPGDRTLNSGTMFQQIVRARVMPVPPGGTNVVDVSDVCDGLIAAASHGQCGRRYILGGHNATFAELFREIARQIGRSPLFVPIGNYARLPMRGMAWAIQHATGSRIITPQIVDDTFAYKFYSNHRAAAELNWSPKTPLSETLSAAWDYYKREGLIEPPLGEAA